MKLPPPRNDLEYTYARAHDLDEIWEPGRVPHVATSHAARFALLRSLVRELAPVPARILDVGCAQGTLGLQLAEEGYRVTLLDIRPAHIDYAKARHEHGDVEFLVGEVGPELPPDGAFDVVICTEVLEHVPAPARLLETLKAKLTDGGAVLLTTPNGQYALSRLPTFATASQSVIDDSEANSRDGDSHRYLFTRGELTAIVRSSGLRVERAGFFLPFWVEGHLKTRYLHRLHFSLFHKALTMSANPAWMSSLAQSRLYASQYLVARLGR
jgi:2-polyprenyl-3-methyl-5-hydroxy-6-metoxy-1,4-benzoquinol methylase